jgi:hypothetical protein
VTVPWNTASVAQSDPEAHSSVIWMHADSHEQVVLAVLLVTVPAQGVVAVPVAVAEQLTFPALEQVVGQLQLAEAPAAIVPTLTLQPQVVLTTTPVTGTEPVLLT